MARRQRNYLTHLTLIFFAALVMFAVNVFAGPSKTTYQAKIVKPDGYPLEGSNVNFKFTILDPSTTCILYSENYNGVDMSSTGGLISFSLGSGIKTFPVSSTTFEQVFSNISPFLACAAGGPATYSPLANDIRRIVMQFNDGNGWQTLPAMGINAVPYAMYANDSMKLNGLGASDFVQVSTIPTCTASEAMRYNGSSFVCVAVGTAATPVTSGSVITALGYTPADGVSLTTLTSTVASANSVIATVSSTVFSVSSTVTSLQNSVAASFASITSSQWVTSGSAIYYLSGRVGIGTSNPAYSLDIEGATRIQAHLNSTSSGAFLRLNYGRGTSETPLIVQNTDRLGGLTFQAYDGLGTYQTAARIEGFMDGPVSATSMPGKITFSTTTSNSITVVERMRIDSNGNVGIGVTNPATKLDVSGAIRIGIDNSTCSSTLAGSLRYNSGVVEYCNGTSWSAFGVSGAGILAINGLTSGSQTFAFGTSGTTPNVSSTGSVHTFNFPLASVASVTGGLLSNADYTTFMNKVSSSTMAASFAAVTTTTNALATSITANTASLSALTTSATNLTSTVNTNTTSITGLTTSATNLTALVNTHTASITALTTTVNNHTTSLTNLAASMAAVTASGWSMSGNAGTSATVNYIGTSDSVDVIFKRANTRSGLIGTANTSFGLRAFSATSATGSYNSAFGLDALANNSLGYQNTAMGASALQTNTTGASNSGFGNYALRLNSTGSYNTGMGESALSSNSTGSFNSAFGTNSLVFATTGAYNTAVGNDALFHNTTGWHNTAIGYQAGYNGSVNLQTNNYSVFVGDNANTSVNGLTNVIAIGYQAQAVQNNMVVLGNTNITRTVLRGAVETYVTDASSGLVVVNSTSTSAKYPIITVSNYASGTTGHPVLSMANSLGEASAPVALSGGMNLGTLLWTGQVTASQTMQGARIDATAEAAFSTNMAPTRLVFSTAPGSGTYQQRMVINSQGFIGVGVNSPNSLMHIGASTSSSAALKLVSGTLLAAPASGAVEYDGFNLYYTDGTNTRRQVASVGGASSPVSGSTVNLASGTTATAPLKFVSGTLTSSVQAGAMEFDGTNYYLSDSAGNRRAIGSLSSITAAKTTNSIDNLNLAQTWTWSTATSENPMTIDTTGLTTGNAFTIANSLNSLTTGSLLKVTTANSSLNSTNGLLYVGNEGLGTSGLVARIMANANNSGHAGIAVKADGSVGIGKKDPSYRLHVYDPNAPLWTTFESGQAGGSYALINFKNTTNSSFVGLERNTGGSIATAAQANSLVLNSGGTAPIHLAVGGAIGYTQLTGGNVGIGTQTPSARLEVTSPNDTSTAMYVGNSTSGGVTGLYFSRWGGVSSPMGIQGTISGSGANAITLQAQAGNVGVGTINPTEKLTVYDGNVHIPYVANKTHGYKLDIGNNLVYLWRNYSYADDSFFISQNWYANDVGTDIIPNAAHTTQAIEMRRHVGIMLKTGPVNTVPAARLTVDPNGFVGVGTTTPGARVHIMTPTSATVNNRFVTGNSNSDLVTATGLTGEVLLDHAVGARFQATSPTSLTRVATYKIDNAPTLSGTITADELLALYVQSGNSAFGSGNVGIGWNVPTTRLQVKDTVAITNTAGPQYLLMGNQDSAGVSHPAIIVAANGNIEFGSGSTWSTATGGTFTSKFYFGDNGYFGIGTQNPASKFSNITGGAVNANTGDQNGTGGNANTLNWGTAAAGYSMLVTNNSTAAGANGLNVRTLASSTNQTVFTVGVGVSSSANTKDYFTVKADGKVGINTNSPVTNFTVNGMMGLQANPSQDHVYMEFYARSATPTTRTAWFGFPGAASTLLSATNEISGGHINFATTGTGKVGINQAAPSYMLDVNGTIRGYGITDSSDIRLKNNIQPLDFSLEKILAIQGVSYYWNDKNISERKQIGFIAQHLEKIFPELVETDNQGMKSVNYSHLVSPLVEAVKSLYAKITSVEAKQEVQARELASVKQENAEIKAENQKLKDRLDRLEKMMNEKK